jgi:hypothetical protein
MPVDENGYLMATPAINENIPVVDDAHLDISLT